MCIRPRTVGAALLSALMASSVHSVELMDESALGGIHINAGNVLNIVGPTAAGGDAPPIQQTAGEQASLSMALGLRASDSNRPTRQVDDERSIFSLVFPQPQTSAPRERSVPSPASDGQTVMVINPRDHNIQSFVQMVQGRPAVNLGFDVRIEELQWEGVRFPEQAISTDGFNQTLYGLEFKGQGRMMRSLE